MANHIDEKFFPVPSHAGSAERNPLLPRNKAGVTPASTTVLRKVLTDNHRKWHIFFNEMRFHNHTAHAALSLWCLGADPDILEASYKDNSSYQRPQFPSPNPITQENWKDHLGDERYFQAYLNFFKAELDSKSVPALLEEYIFESRANFAGKDNQPEMLSRFHDGLLHPHIHTGFGVEFGLPGIFAEGLAQTAVHGPTSSPVIPSSWFDESEAGLVSRFASAVGLADKGPKPNIHAFTILARVLADPALAPRQLNETEFYQKTVANYGDHIVKHVNEWNLDGDLDKKVEELLWTNVLIYAVGGSEEDETFNADFFYMHLVTSSLFLGTIYSQLKRGSQVRLLRSYFAVCLTWYIGRGRATIDIARFFKNDATLHPVAPGPHPTPHKDANPSPTSPSAITPNPWLSIIQSTLVHPDDHLCKLQRTLSEYASNFGNVPAGTFAGTELKDAELVDGTLFIRAAGLTAARIGWVREGEPPLKGSWDRRGFFKAEPLTQN
ncbi:hypothetical protein M413DRAFT_68435 [Hebeloma cylindrosporum]|uniref:Oxidoreductase AflY n=1 Tax=Hebeloma cylindrosporum TaxID=76867 RepID=A0A0C2Y2J6_HEBCY|nr:hypothetical protein M413DRAFT_68435 [Hebeloma cylindrosporum h7]